MVSPLEVMYKMNKLYIKNPYKKYIKGLEAERERERERERRR